MEMNYSENTLHELEQELGVKIYPGTEIMADVGTHHFVKLVGKASNVLVPQPSQNPNDPLNWNRYWKFSAIFLGIATTFIMGIGPLALAPMFGDLMAAFHATLPEVVQFTGVCILVLGFSNFIWVPLAVTFGRRPVLIASSVVCLAANVWRAVATSYGSFMGACVLNGIGAGPCETLAPQVITDCFFLHDRGFYNTLYFAFYFGSLMVGPVISGAMALHVGWRSFWWLNVACFALIICVGVFLFPETKWHRTHPKDVHREPLSCGAKSATVPDHPTATLPNSQAASAVFGEGLSDHVESPQQEEPRDPHLGKGYPSKAQFRLYQISPNLASSLFQAFWEPWRLLLYPIVEFAAFVVSWSASCFLTANLTQSQAFAAPPYNFTSQSVGFTNFATLAGAFIGLLTNGPMSDWISMRATRLNRGIREPEMRLPTLMPYMAISIVGNFIIAFGYQYHWDWKVIVIIGYTCAGIQVAALPAIASTYAVDSYKPVVGSVFVTITVNKNVWGYGFSKFITPWTEADGFVPAIMLNMCLTILWCSFGLVFYLYGKQFRKWTSKSYVHNL